MFNYNNLKGKIVSLYGNQRNFAQANGIPISRVSGVMNNKIFLDNREIVTWCECLQIPLTDVKDYFFAL